TSRGQPKDVCGAVTARSVECRCGSVDSRCIGPFLGQPVSEPALIIPGQATPGRADVGVDARTARASSGPAENVQHPITGAASFVEPAGVAADTVVRCVFPIDGYVDSGTDLLVKFCSFEPLVRQGGARPGIERHAQIPDTTVDVAGLERRRAVPLRSIDPYTQPGPPLGGHTLRAANSGELAVQAGAMVSAVVVCCVVIVA